MSHLIRLAAFAALSAGVPAALVVGPSAKADDAAKPAADSAKAAPVAVEEGFTSIFNGKEFTGWVYGKAKKKDGTDGENKAGKGYQVKDGGSSTAP